MEIYCEGAWRGICDTNWTLTDAHVVCKTLGYSGALYASVDNRYGQGDRKLWLNNVQCNGSEKALTECQHQELDHGECYAGRLVGVICLGKLHRLQMWSNFLSRTIAQKVSLRIFKPPYLLVKLSGQTLLVTLHGACLFAAIYHLNYPRPELNYLPCSSVGIAMVNCSEGRGFESHRGQRVFSFSVWAHFLFGAIAQKVLLGIFIQRFNLPHLNHFISKYLYLVR